MANTKTTALTELASGSQADTDVIPIVDISDTTQAASGSLKKFSWGSIKAALKIYFDNLYSYPCEFSVNRSIDQSLANATYTRVQFDVESFDTGSNFNSFTFTPTTQGYYILSWTVRGTGTALVETVGVLYKNGASVSSGTWAATRSDVGVSNGSTIVYANGTSDYFEVYAYVAATSSQKITSGSMFSGALLRKI